MLIESAATIVVSFWGYTYMRLVLRLGQKNNAHGSRRRAHHFFRPYQRIFNKKKIIILSINQSIFISELYIYFTFAHINVKMNII